MSLLSISALDIRHGLLQAVREVSFQVEQGETVALIGANGAGKTTLLRGIAGSHRPSNGQIRLDGTDITRMPTYQRVAMGIALVPEGRRLFPKLTVEENLLLGAYRSAARRELTRNMAVCYETFPRLAERRGQLAGSLSGGEQQMVALGRALMLAPKILLVDEPSVGLAPILVSRTIDAINEMKQRYQLTVLMAEQNFNQAIRIADRGYVIVHGKIAFEGESAEALNNNELIREFYLGA